MIDKKSQLFVARAGYGRLLQEELADAWKVTGTCVGEDAVALAESAALPRFDRTVFARQYLPLAVEIKIDDASHAVAEAFRRIEVAARRPNRQAGHWTLHAFALEDNESNKLAARLERAILALVETKLPALWKRFLGPEDIVKRGLAAADFVVQLYVPSPQTLWFSIGSFATGISPYIGGNLRMRAREGAPSRSARKIEEAYLVLGRSPQPGETAVDLGAAPGGWTFSLARRGVKVVAVDATDLSLPDSKVFADAVTHVRDNGLRYHPDGPVDWLVCDMVVAPGETMRVLRYWLEKGWMRHFIVNLKLPKKEPWAAIKDALATLDRHAWPVMRGRHLFHDRWEITLVGGKDTPASGATD